MESPLGGLNSSITCGSYRKRHIPDTRPAQHSSHLPTPEFRLTDAESVTSPGGVTDGADEISVVLVAALLSVTIVGCEAEAAYVEFPG